MSNGFRYDRKSYSIDRKKRIAVQFKNIDTQGFFYIRTQENNDHLMRLEQELKFVIDKFFHIVIDSLCFSQFYLDSISDQLWVKEKKVGLTCVSQYQNQFRRVLIKAYENDQYCIEYVDYGETKSVPVRQFYCKYLLNYFAFLPVAAIRCRFASITDQISLDIQQKIIQICKTAPIYVEFLSDSIDELFSIDIYTDANQRLYDRLMRHMQKPIQKSYNPLEDYEDQDDQPIFQPEPNRSKQRSTTFNRTSSSNHPSQHVNMFPRRLRD